MRGAGGRDWGCGHRFRTVVVPRSRERQGTVACKESPERAWPYGHVGRDPEVLASDLVLPEL